MCYIVKSEAVYNTINLFFCAISDSFHLVDYDKIVLWRIQINKMMITANQSSHSHVSVLHGIMLRGFAHVFTPGKAVCKHDVIETNLCVKNEHSFSGIRTYFLVI